MRAHRRLGTVAQAVLGRGKTIEAEHDEDKPELILKAFAEDRTRFAEYCLEDSRLVRDILIKETLIELTMRRTALTGLPLAKTAGSVAVFEHLYRGELRARGYVAPTRGVDRPRMEAVAGGLGLAVISRHALAARPADDQLAILDVAGFPVQSSWFTLHPRGKRLSPVAAVFLAHLERTARDWSERRDRC